MAVVSPQSGGAASSEAVAAGVAERYVADLLWSCQGIASLFDEDVLWCRRNCGDTELQAKDCARTLAQDDQACQPDRKGGRVAQRADIIRVPSEIFRLCAESTDARALELAQDRIDDGSYAGVHSEPVPGGHVEQVRGLSSGLHTDPFLADARNIATRKQCRVAALHPSPWNTNRESESARLQRLLSPRARRRPCSPKGLKSQEPCDEIHPSDDTFNMQPSAPSAPAPLQPRPRSGGFRQVLPRDSGVANTATEPFENKAHSSAVQKSQIGTIHAEQSELSDWHPPTPRPIESKVTFGAGSSKNDHVALAPVSQARTTIKKMAPRATMIAQTTSMTSRRSTIRGRYRSLKAQPSVLPNELDDDTQMILKDSFRDIKEGLCQRFKETTRETFGVETKVAVEQTIDMWNLYQTARDLSMSVDDCLMVKTVFDSFDTDGSGTLDLEEFELAVLKLLHLQLRDSSVPLDRVRSMCEWYWWDGDADNSGSIDFKEFLKWYSSNGFHEDLLLTENQRELRRIAKQHGVAPDYVDTIKRCFDTYDTDKSGEVDIDEFRQVLHKALRMPAHLELPKSRVQYFWAEIDRDGSGKAVFEEFLDWWLKYFEEASVGKEKNQLPFEDFYKQVRRVGKKYLDPPAYSAKVAGDGN